MEDNPEIIEPVEPVKTRKPGSGRHPKGCQCGKHKPKPLYRSEEAKFVAIRDGGSPEVLSKQEIYDADDIVLVTQRRDMKSRIVQWLELRSQNPDLKRKELASLMGITDKNLEKILYRASRDGLLKFNNPLERLEHEIMPKVMDNLSTLMDEKDRVATIETAKATVFKQYQEAKGIIDRPTTILALKVEVADPSQIKQISSSIVGVPRIIEAEVKEEGNEA